MKWLLGFACVLVLPGCLTVPLAPDRPAYAEIAGTPAGPGTEMSVTPLKVGSKDAPRCGAAGEESCFDSAPIAHVAYLVKHPKATFLVDATLSTKGREDLARFPWPQRSLLDYTAEGSLKEALAAAGSPKVDFVFLTHAHWDHTSGLVDLVHPRVVMGPGEQEFVRTFPKDKPSVMPDHLAGAEVETFKWDGPAYENFPVSHDWFGDGSVVLVPMPGHTPGSMGVFLNSVHGRRLLLVGDSAWSMDAIERPSHKLKPMSDIVDNDREKLSETLWRLHHLHAKKPELLMVPAHDGKAYEAVKALNGGK